MASSTAARLTALAATCLVAACSSTPTTPPGPITLAIVNAAVWTGDAERPTAEAVAVSGDRIAAVGTSAEIRALTSPATEVVDAGGQFLVPGFIDSHVHFLDGGFRLASVQLRDARTREEFVARIGAFAKTVPAGTWITGGDWDHQLWGGEQPARDWIDAVTPDHPVWVNRLDGHMALANSAALLAAGVTRAAGHVTGGEIVRDGRGELTGLLKDNAMDLVQAKMPAPSAAMQDRALDAAMHYVAEQGVTSVHHMGSWDDLDTFTRAHRAGRLGTRIYAAVPLPTWQRLADTVRAKTYGPDGRGDAWLRIGLLKGFVDGSLGSHTAAFIEPFTDAPATAASSSTRPRTSPPGSAAPTRPGFRWRSTPSATAPTRPCSTSTTASATRAGCATAGSASSTRSTSPRPTSSASAPCTSSPACSPTTPSTMGDGPRR
jgi:predicted amidohydrolase YtcJ